MQSAGTRSANLFAFFCCVLFVALGVVWIARIGIQTDEALFSAAIYQPFDPQFRMRVFKHDVPLMVMSYVGTVKAWLYVPVFALWKPSAASARIPMVILGSVTVWLFYRLLHRTLGLRAALAGCALLATDTMFLLTTRWDWGPVAIQHFCLVAAMLALVRFHQERSLPWLAWGFFLLGIGMWDKAIFSWLLAGLGVAALAVFGKECWKALTFRHVSVAAAAFLLGALPLLIYNIRHNWNTFRSNTVWSTEAFGYKASLLKDTWQGASLFGAVTREEWDGPLREPQDGGERLLISFNKAAGYPRKNLLLYGLALAILLLPLVWKTPARKAALFAVIFCAVAFLLMAFTKGAGTGTHHPVLLWPLPHLMLAGVYAAASHRIRFGGAALGALVGVLCAANVLLTTSYYANMLRNGGVSGWSDAIYKLSDVLERAEPKWVCVLDWGFADNLRLLQQGRLPLCVGVDPVSDTDKQIARRQIAEPGAVFVAHTEGNEFNEGVAKRFSAFAEEQGYRKSDVQFISDANGRKIIALFRVLKADSAYPLPTSVSQ